uniref:ADAM metallopeptidase domain 33 n=1 Tax=Pelodiscus sinensis TaxID=13735 RepID=K7F8H5_PELSI
YQDHCYYHGHVRGHEGSWVVLSTCSGISGLIVLNDTDSYYLKPLGPPEPEHHVIYRAEHLPIRGGTCGHRGLGGSSVAEVARGVQLVHRRAKRDAWRTLKYMELFIVADYTLFLNQNRNLGRTKQRLLEIANFVDKVRAGVGAAVAGRSVWIQQPALRAGRALPDTSPAPVSRRRAKALSRCSRWPCRFLTGLPLGWATPSWPCAPQGGIPQDHSELPIGAAATMAHEIGHNFGMSHDSQGCCVEATPDEGGCVMAAATGPPFPRVFSACSKRQLQSYFQKGGGMCLFNLPDTKDLVVGKKCGKMEESGPRDDGRAPGECTNPCCNAHNCTLKAGAQCAHGECCQSCQGHPCACPRSPGSRIPTSAPRCAPCCPHTCMVPSTGRATLPPLSAPCWTRLGTGAWPAPDACFQDVNTAGDAYGNCGTDSQGHYVKCNRSDSITAVPPIQCQSSAKKPKQTNTVSMDTTIRFNGREVKCRGAFMYTNRDEEGDLPDPGLVMTGTKCGDGMV